MVQFISKALEDTYQPDGIIVLDTSLQGNWTTAELDIMRFLYPRLFKCYYHLCRNAYSNMAGRAVLIEDNGQKFVLLFTKKSRHDSNEEAVKNFKSALDNLKQMVSVEKEIYSGIVGRDSKLFNSYLNILMDWTQTNKYTWNVCRMQRSK